MKWLWWLLVIPAIWILITAFKAARIATSYYFNVSKANKQWDAIEAQEKKAFGGLFSVILPSLIAQDEVSRTNELSLLKAKEESDLKALI